MLKQLKLKNGKRVSKMKKIYEFNKKWLDELLKDKNNTNARYEFSDNDTRILLTYVEILQNRIDKAIDKLEFYNSGEALWYVPIQEIIDI